MSGLKKRYTEMGYYTTYSLTLEEGPREQFQKMLEDIDAMMGDNEMSSFESINAKLVHHFRDNRVYFTRHDRRTRLHFRQVKFV